MITHQPDEDAFRSVLAEDIGWEPFAAFPPSARLAVVVGHPAEPAPYVVRVRLPSGVKLMPHWHPANSQPGSARFAGCRYGACGYDRTL